MKDYFFLAFNNLKRRKMRSWLTMIGIFIGIAAVVALISLGQGLQASIEKQFEALGTDKITITPKGMFGGMPNFNPLTEDDLKIIENVPGVNIATPYVMESFNMKYRSQNKNTLIIGIDPSEYQKLFSQTYTIEFGRDFKQGDKTKVVLGWNAANKDFDKNVNIGNKVEIGNQSFEVIGILKKTGSPNDDSSIIMPIGSLREITGDEEDVSGIFVGIKAGEDVNKVADEIEKQLKRDRGEKLSEESQFFDVLTAEQLLASFGDIISVVQAVLVGIAAISLLVGGIGIANTMYTSVLERTKEIGTMKAVGAKNSDILILFLIESGLLGLIGGVIGIAIGIGLSKIAEYIAAQQLGANLLQASIDPMLIIGALVFSFLIGAISGVFPAMQASKLRPVDALRYE